MLMGMNLEQKKMLNLGTASEYSYLTMVTISIIPLSFVSSSNQYYHWELQMGGNKYQESFP